MSRFAVALGSNLGDRIEYLQAAVTSLRAIGNVVAISGLYETEPAGDPDQDDYLNAVVVLETTLGPEALLARLHDIEDDAGRKREVRWGPRTLDLDIVVSDAGRVRTPDLEIPHPRALGRRFVLQPMMDVWPDAELDDGVPVFEAITSVKDQVVVGVATVWADPEASSSPREERQ